MPTAISGKNIKTLKTHHTGPNSLSDQNSCPAKLASMISAHIEITTIKREKYQNSDLDARPLKSTYFVKQVLIDVIKSIFLSLYFSKP